MGVVDELWRFPRWTQSPGEELANTISHGIGLLAALIGTPVLLLAALDAGGDGFFIGTIIFVVTMLMLYLGSTLYHAWPQTRAKCVLQVFDHSAIFLLIAGTYTPFTLGPLRGVWGWTMLGLIWALALFGIIMKADPGDVAPSETGVISLSRHGLVGAHRDPTADLCGPATRIVLVSSGRNRVYDGSPIFR